ncbi:hypothetical protein [Rhizobium ruizarguesonis]|uniref:hypothetical protein n=1 Tax=Rhizobium ruizarguesonis TaxID=2081791 RepID=UPI0013EEC07C|nr:hypothetical protein [Rhizobium ruizarguesonis]WSH69760.1 hypothetical protein U8Q05_36940 [Rhizobium ruizarguesonis]
MEECKGYLNTDELQADDELSPMPARETPLRQSEKAGPECSKDERLPPRAATTE